jgi:uncharacterized OB-fold protein
MTVTPLQPYPEPEPYARFFWEYAKRHQLAIQRCDQCGRFQYWPSPVCRNCLSFALSPAPVSGRGHVYTYTVAMQSFHPFFDHKVPFIIAVIERTPLAASPPAPC